MAFRDKETLDFTAQDIFVLTGPTGSGKSSILDAMSFALYGETPRLGSRDLKKLIYQDVENPAQKARVEFAFRHLGRDYRIARQVTHTSHRVELDSRESPEDEWSSYATGSVAEIKRLIPELLGLNFDAFRRVLMLPQGGFDQFLKQDGASDRRQLLMNLAQLGVYEKIQQAADVQRRELTSRLDNLTGELAGLGAVSAEELIKMEQDLEGVEAQSQLDQDLLVQYENTLKTSEALWEALNEEKVLQTALEKHRIAGESLADKEQKVRQGEKLLRLKPDLNYLENGRQKEKNLLQIQSQLEKETLALEARAQALTQERETLANNAKKIPQWQQTLKDLQGLLPRVERHTDLLKRYQQARQKHKELQQARDSANEALTRARQELEQQQQEAAVLKDQWQAIEVSAERIELLYEVGVQLKTLEEELKPRFAAADQEYKAWKTEGQSLNQTLSDARDRLETARQNTHTARTTLEQAESEREALRQASMARHLRQHLRERLEEHAPQGSECPVCLQSVTQLPPEATSGDTSAIAQKLKQAREHLRQQEQLEQKDFQAFTQAESALAQHQKRATRVKTERQNTYAAAKAMTEQLRERLDQQELPTRETLRAEYAEEKKRDKQKKQLENELKQGAGTRQQLELKVGSYEATRTEKERALAEVQQEMEAEREQGEIIAAELQAALQVDSDYATVRQDRQQDIEERLEQQIQASEQFKAREQAWQKQEEVHRQREQNNSAQLEQVQEDIARLESQLGRERETLGYPDLKTLRADMPTPEALDTWREEITSHQVNGMALRRDLEKVQTLIAGRHVTESVYQQHQEQYTQLKSDMEQRRTETALLKERLTQARQRQERAKTLNEERNAVRVQQELYARIHHDLGSKRLPDFLAKRILERVMAEGSEELSTLSNQRYCFEMDDKEELVILDAWNAMEPRSVKTLSGGESFLASLALALALNKYLSNGIQLDSLFIDEGFGTLDGESLELATSVIEKLQLSGKCVGVITHIPELAERFEARIEVIKSETGAKLKPV